MTEQARFLLPALRRARDLIDRDYAVPIDLDAMAAEAGYSRFHFARAFTAAYGETPRTYLTRRRIERAKTLLRTANLSEDAEAVRTLVAKGSLGGGVFETADCKKTFEELSAKGVTFLQEPAERPYGIEALFRDDSGNWFSLTQPKWIG